MSTAPAVKYIITPSTFTPRSSVPAPDLLDLNRMFWDQLFSQARLESLFSGFLSKQRRSDSFRDYLRFAAGRIEDVKRITREALAFPYEEKRLFYCFNIYVFILSVLNSEYPDYNFTLAYGAHLKDSFADFEKYISRSSDFFGRFYGLALSDAFFADHGRYLVSIKWENDIFHALALSVLLKNKFRDVSVWIDFRLANEQTDFTHWQNDGFIKRHIDGFANLYRGGEAECPAPDSGALLAARDNERYGVTKVGTRLFRGGCYWRKCTFCTINSRYRNDVFYDKLTDEAKQAVHRLINSLKLNQGLFFLVLADEAVEAEILLYFAEQIIAHGLNVRWNARTRFSALFTDDNCRKLAASGLRFLGFGLESVNRRVLALMNKRERDYAPDELNEILRHCDAHGINAHTYFILGFPSETKSETDETVRFIESNLENRSFFSFSANIFYLMKGSEIFRHPDRFGIEIVERDAAHKLGAIAFTDLSDGEKYTREELFAISKRLYSRLFFRNPDSDFQVQLGYLYWDFLDRLNLFYDQKLLNRVNPYRQETPIPELDSSALDRRYRLLPLPLLGSPPVGYLHVTDNREIEIAPAPRRIFFCFLSAYDERQSLRFNIEQALAAAEVRDRQTEAAFRALIQDLLASSFLYLSKTKDDIV